MKEEQFFDDLYDKYPVGSGEDNFKIRHQEIINFYLEKLDKELKEIWGNDI